MRTVMFPRTGYLLRGVGGGEKMSVDGMVRGDGKRGW